MDFNRVILVGRATANPELRTTPAGQSVTTIGVATNRTWTDKAGARQEATEFTNVVMWGRTAEIAAQFVMKGSTVLIEGRLETRSWEDKQGQQRKTTEVICDNLQLGPRPLQDAEKQAFNDRPQKATEEKVEPVIRFEEDGDIKPEDIPF